MTERAGPCGATIGTEGAVGLVTTLVLESAPGRSGAPSKCCWWGGLGRASGTSERQGERLRGPPADGGQRELRALWISNLFESSARTRLRVRVASSVSSPEGP